MNRICLVSCFLPVDEQLSAVCARFAELLAEQGHQLVLLTNDEPGRLSVPAVQVPFELRGFLELVPSQLSVEAPLDESDRMLIERDRSWNESADYPVVQAEAGLEACRRFFQEFIGELRPVAACVWGDSLPQSVVLRHVLERCQVPAFVLERGLLPDTFMLEAKGNGSDSGLWGDTELASLVMSHPGGELDSKAAYFNDPAVAKYSQSGWESPDALRARLGLGGRRVIVFFGQHDPASGLVPRDEKARRLSPVFASVSDALSELVQASIGLDEIALLYKPHPKDAHDYRELAGNALVRVVSDVGSQSLFALADVVAVMTSTVQFEALWHAKPIFLMAQSPLAGKGVAYEVHDRESVRTVLSQALERVGHAARQQQANRLLNGLIDRYLIGLHDETPTATHLAELATFIVQAGASRPDGVTLEAAIQSLSSADLGDAGEYAGAESTGTPFSCQNAPLALEGAGAICEPEALWAGEKYDRLQRSLTKVLESHPGHARALNDCAVLEAAAGEYVAAKDYLVRARSADPYLVQPVVNLVRILTAEGAAPAADAVVDDYLGVHPNPSYARTKLESFKVAVSGGEHTETEEDPLAPVSQIQLGESAQPAVPEIRALEVKKVSSFEDFERHCREHRELHTQIEEFESRLVPGQEPFRVPGYCYVCQTKSDFLVDFSHCSHRNGRPVPNWRERMVCPTCGLNNRLRASVHLFEQACGVQKDDSIYITEQVSPLFKALSQHYPNLVGSEYLGDEVVLGSIDARGIRNESLTNLSFEDGSFDHIMSFDVLEHVPDYRQAVAECFRCLKPGGTLMFSVPFARSSRTNIVRAKLDADGSVEHLLPPEYHGDPVNPGDGCLCYYHFGWELLDELRELGFEDVTALYYWSADLGYLGGEQSVFFATKPLSQYQLKTAEL